MKWIAALMLSSTTALAGALIIEDFTDGDAPGWSYVSDRVMGGVSDGGATFQTENGSSFARLEGTVSTANNGGFIQIRKQLSERFQSDSAGLQINLRGNGQRYYVHLRTTTSRRPWQYFSASFDTTNVWDTAELTWSNFTSQGGLSAEFAPGDITSIGLVAYGADFEARLDVKQIGIVPLSN